MPATRRFTVSAGFLALGVVLVGCTSPSPTPTSSTSAGPRSTATATPVPVAGFLPGGTAQANKPWFDAVNTKLFAAGASANGRAIIDSLVTAGFDKAAMQVTPDKTSIKGEVDSILFSVKIGDSCLLGQHGGGGYSSAVEAALKSGLCLIGKTRSIDW
ncbi:hypothetical protein [Frigoribacterium sp. CG_9.8]|uniref:DUF6993 domain-containing protein n=1 Tax=Frigoribacterium sp. CG_9.8 TaxID=2787733 RepID=UPI0018CB3CFC|nr:hypothetical protein [Frigoribacterium sp. CG_9.8]MBG6107171.1 hypothetical protein [Frigoribacterium sp. CG_9.8]